jgi:hypothetical protein
MKQTYLFLIFMLPFLCCCNYGIAQYTTHIPSESTLVLPPDYNPSISYPVVVMLPFTGGDAEYMFNAYAYEAGSMAKTHSEKLNDIINFFNARNPENPKSFVVILPKGKGSRKDHNWRGFELCYKRYEARVIADILQFSKNYNLDLGKVFLTGVSLGGDLSWALSMRNPELFQGALVMGSRCSYFPPKGNLEIMHDKNFAFFMTMGMKEAEDRLDGMRFSRKHLDSLHVLNIYKEIPDLYHNKAPLWLFLDGLEYLFNVKYKTVENINQNTEVQTDISGVYKGNLEINYFDRSKDKNDITMQGNGLFVPYNTEFHEGLNLEITKLSTNKVRIQLLYENTATLNAYISKSAVENCNIEFTIYDQESGNFKYRGVSVADGDSKIHGMISKNGNEKYLTISFEMRAADNPEKFKSFTFFAPL